MRHFTSHVHDSVLLRLWLAHVYRVSGVVSVPMFHKQAWVYVLDSLSNETRELCSKTGVAKGCGCYMPFEEVRGFLR